MGDKKHRWVKNVTEHMHKGAFKEKAEEAGESTEAYAREEEHAPGKLGKEARLAESLMKMHHAHKKNSASTKTIRHSMYGDKE